MRNRANVLQVARRVASARLGRGHPIYLVHALTARCNARCGFCAWNPDFYDPRQQLSTDAIKRLYSDARREGFVGLSVWGGEPLVHPDFGEIARHAHDVGLVTHMVTNGFLLDRKMDAVIPYVDRVCISLDHPSRTHDEIRGIRGLFDKIVAATREIKRRDPNKQIVFICTLLRQNADAETLRSMAELMADLGVLGVFNGFRQEAASDHASAKLDAWAPSQEQLAEAFVTLAALKRRGFPILDSYTYMSMMIQGPPVYRCHWPKFMLPVEANGDVVDCMHWGTRPIGNVERTPFAEILKSQRLSDLAGDAGEQCHKCVSIHRVEISEVSSGNFEPLLSWSMLRNPPQPRAG